MEQTKEELEIVIKKKEDEILGRAYDSLYLVYEKVRLTCKGLVSLFFYCQTPTHFSCQFCKIVTPSVFSTINKQSCSNRTIRMKFVEIVEKSAVKEINETCIYPCCNADQKHSAFIRRSINLIPKTIEKFTIVNCSITKNQFRKIIQVGRHIKEIKFIYCRTNLKGLQLSKSIHYSTQAIALTSGSPFKRLQIKDNRKMVGRFLKAASCTDLKSSLKLLEIGECVNFTDVNFYGKELGFKQLKSVECNLN
ncbi:unnamed protein product [Moneuplotes crassus]|uniref:Uncharacterized protein n=1 Tax=Euplotes crassus TaxID=5936 RepID=A0AAD1XTN0_EUPCR|nr:unnamed protein product [Moneuplotes crassus]